MRKVVELTMVLIGLLASTMAACAPDGSRTVTLEVVRDHVGGDDRHADVWTYPAPEGFRISHYRPIVRSSYGDATYTPRLINDRTLQISWATRSHYHVVDTKTASLNLDVEVALVPIAAASRGSSDVSPSAGGERGDRDTPLMQILVGVAVTVVGGLLLHLLTRR
jgi:hypothetical protein